ncbi:hypothetical protein BFW01_g9302 [Lasiodiplodia theobromae]|uniref:uncharacterized protein n=1 Tax=Lasiodiplodia theobromae TaxID=45133 RepID=UPI0015C4006D|nr:uncharacterized protein LTHEOB_10308 [Lasiodiplodia theobromae]KAF4539376.1 hypothetical protein LTHEOB_10308 [Lasiodiplodia theobromae]KAF9638405.1 hypothetical protein BFW01_g9302 [Lasiodiplodia theobromae]
MRPSSSLVASLLVIAQAADVNAKGLSGQFLHALHRRAPSFEDTMMRQAHEFFNELEARQSEATSDPSSISTTPASNGTVDPDEWDSQTKTSCDAAMIRLAAKPDNPSGLAVCYNIPFFNNQTGVFQAELRMYNMTPPFDPWTGVTAADISMTLSYQSATVQASNTSDPASKRDLDSTLAWPPIKLREIEVNDLARRQSEPSGPQAIKVLMYVGQVDQDTLDSAQSAPEMQNLLVPSVKLTARSPQDMSPLSTELSATKASFLNGVFSKKGTTSASDVSASNVANAVSFLIPGYRLAPLEVPGLTLPINLLFPTGLIITLVWTVAFFGVVGWGTLGRIRFRDQYRRRVNVNKEMNQARI